MFEFETITYFVDRAFYMCITFVLYAVSGLVMDIPQDLPNWYDFEEDSDYNRPSRVRKIVFLFSMLKVGKY